MGQAEISETLKKVDENL
jgi:hypothetical protein